MLGEALGTEAEGVLRRIIGLKVYRSTGKWDKRTDLQPAGVGTGV